MVRPAVSEITEEAYAALGPLTAPDAEHDYPLLRLVAAPTDALQIVEDLGRDREDVPGWAVVMDPDTVPYEFLGWLAQFVGVHLLTGLDEASQRLRVSETAGFGRGTVDALKGAARQLLTGSRQVVVLERDTSPYHFTVRTYLAETPDQAAVLAALVAAKPAGLVLTYQVATGATYAQLTAYKATYPLLDAAFGTYQDQTLYIP